MGVPAKRTMTWRMMLACLLTGLLVCARPAFSEDEGVVSIVSVGPAKLLPSLNIQYRYDDNIFSQDDPTTSSAVSIIKPGLAFTISNGISEFALLYSAEQGEYESSPEDNYLEQRAAVGIHHAFRRWAILDLGAGLNQLHEARGEAYSQGSATALLEPDRFEVGDANAMLRLGTRRSRGMFEYQLAATQLRYVSRTDQTAGRNYDYSNGRITYHFNLSAKTSLLAETRYGLYDYISETSSNSRDSIEQHHYLGVSWEFSELTSGAIKVGQQSKVFNDSTLGQDNSASWEVTMLWTPTPLTTLKMVSAGKNQESVGVGTHVSSRGGYLSLRHSLTRRMAIDMRTNATQNIYKPNDRVEYLGVVSMKTIFSPTEWLSFELGAEHSQRRSDQVGLDYRRNIINMGLKIGI